jgi:hypothetical protein
VNLVDFFIHLANILILVSFSARNLLLLRGLNIAASGLFMTHFALQPMPVWSAIGWNVVFASINLWQSWRTILERRPPLLSAAEQSLHHLAFAELPLRPFRRLLDAGCWADEAPASVLAADGAQAEHLWLIAEGHAEVRHPGGGTRTLGPGEFVGDAAYLGHGRVRGDLVAASPMRLVRWPVATLRALCARDAELADVLQRALGRGLVRKLERAQ